MSLFVKAYSTFVNEISERRNTEFSKLALVFEIVRVKMRLLRMKHFRSLVMIPVSQF